MAKTLFEIIVDACKRSDIPNYKVECKNTEIYFNTYLGEIFLNFHLSNGNVEFEELHAFEEEIKLSLGEMKILEILIDGMIGEDMKQESRDEYDSDKKEEANEHTMFDSPRNLGRKSY